MHGGIYITQRAMPSIGMAYFIGEVYSMEELEKIDLLTKEIWQGKECNIDEIVSLINRIMGKIDACNSLLKERGITFPMEFVREAVKNLNYAFKLKDDYILADCLFFEWREIVIVLNELEEERA